MTRTANPRGRAATRSTPSPDRRLEGVELALRRDVALDALEQGLDAGPLGAIEPLVHHRDRGVQDLSIPDTEHLARAALRKT